MLVTVFSILEVSIFFYYSNILLQDEKYFLASSYPAQINASNELDLYQSKARDHNSTIISNFQNIWVSPAGN